MTLAHKTILGRMYRWDTGTLSWVVWDGSLTTGAVTIGTVNQGNAGVQSWKVDGSGVVQSVSATDLDIRNLLFATDKVDASGSNISVANIIETIQLTGQHRGKTAYCFDILGRRAGFTSVSVLNDIKEFDNAVADIPVLSNSTLDIISSSTNDAAAGTGVRTVKVVYINNSNALVESGAITLDGTTLVTSVLTGVNEVLWMETNTVGSGGVAAGDIRLRINGGTVEVEQITAGGNKSLSARFMVPAGYTGYLASWKSNAINNDQDLRLRALAHSLDRSLGTAYLFQSEMYLANNTNQVKELPFLKIPATAKVKCSTLSAGTPGTVRCDTSFVIAIIAD